MLDNLINIASQDCTRKKREKITAAQPEPVPETPAQATYEPPRTDPDQPERSYVVRLVSLDEDDSTKPVAVTLSIDGNDGTGAAMPDRGSMMDAVADAAARAIERVNPEVTLTVTATVVDTASDGTKVVTVVGSCDANGRRYAMAGTCHVQRDVYRAVAEAVASAYVSLRI